MNTLTTIWLLHAAALLVPGANTLLVSQLAASGSRTSAFYAAAGVATGAFIWSGAAVLGLTVVFSLFPAARLALQLAGAAYLLFLGYRLWRSPPAPLGCAAALRPLQAVRLGLLTNLSNPKAAFFFGSVFSASLPVDARPLVLGGAVMIVVLNALCWHLLLAYLFSGGMIQAGYASQRRFFTRCAGGLMALLGVFLLGRSVAEIGAPH